MTPVIFATVSPSSSSPAPLSSAVPQPGESHFYGLLFFLFALWLLPIRPQRRRS
ncbi:hypothetical protein [Synechococcus elongatus]|uniref:hypothetical protein n=1 Tax=Synechococcus elongatus TaxID=32046 RepID=UPI00003A0427|nr:hypothetical protein [Synechococcus elongatus]MBD2587014.1 hypothetical protein [Synechococcus elongatus FACHB-242]MBD2688085.1 hypothetical protein [Synechococcus elongatus FACHB-1061]MBD2706204.1 hypothetical protein [Synechococcus elongatus PCC 7942 = FACHB-805]UOW72090.1 hypothetical protein PCC7943_2351 [Synechococcus elongatus PCC 7943]UOW74809.1 hypothetical protein PCC6311_2349 [Synechococcus elongatus PCC 6311]